MKNKLVIFDFDGVIALNTEEITMGVIADLVNRPNEEISKMVTGMGGKELIATLNNKFKTNITENEIMNNRIKIMSKDGILKKDPDLIPFVELLSKNKIEYVIATSSSKKPVNIALNNLNLNKYFKKIYSIDDYPNFRSKKELYEELGRKYINMEILIIEDSERGIKSATDSKIGQVIKYSNFKEIENVIKLKFQSI